MLSINCRGKLLEVNQPIIMGILNVTPDSFYDKSRLNSEKEVLFQASKMIKEGASVLDIGGFSSRPGADTISIQEEINRVVPVVELLHRHFPDVLLSVDTFRADVAQKALDAGAHIINDISGFNLDEALLDVVAAYEAPYILMHMQGVPSTMQENPSYEDIIVEIFDFFIDKIAILRAKGIRDIVLDPGFGFGKTVAQNYHLLKNVETFKQLELPLMLGLSRKSMIWKPLAINPEKALNGTTALHMYALQQGAQILRVHDVQAAFETIQLWQLLQEN